MSASLTSRTPKRAMPVTVDGERLTTERIEAQKEGLADSQTPAPQINDRRAYR